MRRVAAKSVILAPKADKVAVRGVRGGSRRPLVLSKEPGTFLLG